MKKLFQLAVCLLALLPLSCTANSGKADSTNVDPGNTTVGKTEEVKVNAENGLPTVIDFSATWCLPCRKMKPVFEELEKEYKGKFNFVNVDIDDNPLLTEDYHIEAVPTFVFLDKDGREVNRLVGGQPKDSLVNVMNSIK